MVISKELSDRIVIVSYRYLDRPFDWETFNCVKFVRQVYLDVGIHLPLLSRTDPPPPEFHLSAKEFNLMPIGHSVFFKRREFKSDRPWSHLAIITGHDELIHCCARHLGSGVVVTAKSKFMEIYALSP